MDMDIQIIETQLDVKRCLDAVASDACGGNALFVGTVRNQTKGKSVTHLEFEVYGPMAIKELKKIGNLIKEKWNAIGISIHHRVGRLEIGETAVIIAIATPHRDAAFAACQFAIDTLKETVPIWKKEFYEDGAIWVAAHP